MTGFWQNHKLQNHVVHLGHSYLFDLLFLKKHDQYNNAFLQPALSGIAEKHPK